MSQVIDTSRSAVEKALEAARATFKQYQHVSNWTMSKSDYQTLSILSAVGSALERLCDQLERVVQDTEVCIRLDKTTVDGREHQLKLMDGLLGDLGSILEHLENTGRGTATVGETSFKTYARVLKRYVEVLKTAQKQEITSVFPALCSVHI
jgi:hypothetical protein